MNSPCLNKVITYLLGIFIRLGGNESKSMQNTKQGLLKKKIKCKPTQDGICRLLSVKQTIIYFAFVFSLFCDSP